MKELPILFSNEMVKALLAGTKTQTRRSINASQNRCPFGNAGDILWVRETHYAYGSWIKNGTTQKGRQKWKFVVLPDMEVYFEDTKGDITVKKNGDRLAGYYKRLARFMPKSYARIRLIVKEVSTQNLIEISSEDCIAEGIVEYEDGTFKNYFTHEGLREEDGVECLLPLGSFKSLWCSINSVDSWKENPRVWVVKFMRKLLAGVGSIECTCTTQDLQPVGECLCTPIAKRTVPKVVCCIGCTYPLCQK